jgi:hypothetical protein
MRNTSGIFAHRGSYWCRFGQSTKREMRGVAGGCSHLQCLSTQSAVYFQRPGSATAPFVLRRLLGPGEGVSPVLRLSESHEQAQGLGRTAESPGQRLAWDAAVSLAAALERQL